MDYNNSFGYLVSLMFYIGVVSTTRSIEIVPRGGLPLEFINLQPHKMGPAFRIHQHAAPKKGVRL